MDSTDKIDRICYEILERSLKVEIVASIDNVDELYLLLDHYNWDDGFEIPTAIANHPLCELAIAIRLYWLAEADYWFDTEVEPDVYNQDHFDFSKLISDRLIDNHYKPGELSHDEGFGRVAVHKFKTSGFPEILYQPVVGRYA